MWRNGKWPRKTPEEELLDEMTDFLGKARRKHGVSVLSLIALLDMMRNHLSTYLLENGLDHGENEGDSRR